MIRKVSGSPRSGKIGKNLESHINLENGRFFAENLEKSGKYYFSQNKKAIFNKIKIKYFFTINFQNINFWKIF